MMRTGTLMLRAGLLSALALVLAACVVPGGYNGLDHIIAVPRASAYPLNYSYNPLEEITVEAVTTQGETSRVPVSKTQVSAASLTGSAAATDFSRADRKKITVTYQGKSDYFYLDVGDATGSGTTTPPGGGGSGDTGLIIVVQ